jgi:restriction endonuclease Mrr
VDEYPALAEAFALTSEQRSRPRNDTSEPLWHNRVQWARRKLVDDGLMKREPRGLWALSESGNKRFAGKHGRTTNS